MAKVGVIRLGEEGEYTFQKRYLSLFDERQLLDWRADVNKKNDNFGKNHPDVATSLNNLAGLLEDQGKYDEAKPLFRRALAIREAQLGPDHLDVAQSLNNLAELLRTQGKYTEAEPFYRRALEISEGTAGRPDPPNTQTVRQNLDLLLADSLIEPDLERQRRQRPLRMSA